MIRSDKQLLPHLLQAIDERWWLRHGLFWLVRTLLVTWLFLFELRTTTTWTLAMRDALILLPLHLIATYSLLYGVLPQLWADSRRWQFPTLLASWFGLGLAFNFAYRYFIYIPSHQVVSTFPDYSVVYAAGSHMPLLTTAGVAACLRVYRQWRRKQMANARLIRENYQAELQLLKAQIHPHFLFNTLNNLYALTLRQSSQAPAVVDRLTGLLHFVLKQGNKPLVALSDEVTLLRNYLALEQLRYGSRLTLEFQASHMPPAGRIAPLLLLPLAENAFKHGAAEQLGQAHIRIVLAVEGAWFTCCITNTKNPAVPAGNGPQGIGLHNVRQRLQLLYPQCHQLLVEDHDHAFSVQLKLQLLPTRPRSRRPNAAAGAPAASVAYPAHLISSFRP